MGGTPMPPKPRIALLGLSAIAMATAEERPLPALPRHGVAAKVFLSRSPSSDRAQPIRFFSAARYFSCVRRITSAGSRGPGGVWSHLRARRWSRTNCLS